MRKILITAAAIIAAIVATAAPASADCLKYTDDWGNTTMVGDTCRRPHHRPRVYYPPAPVWDGYNAPRGAWGNDYSAPRGGATASNGYWRQRARGR